MVRHLWHSIMYETKGNFSFQPTLYGQLYEVQYGEMVRHCGICKIPSTGAGPTEIKGKLLLQLYSQLYEAQYREISR